MKITKRYLNEMANMYGLPNELYTMNRGVKYMCDCGNRCGEREKRAPYCKWILRYDITEIPAGKINGQYNKSKGHIHSTGHKELYEVLEGHAFFLFQNDDDFYYVECEKGQYVIVPGDYYHVTVNIGKKPLKIGNWVSDKCVSDYSLIEKMNGMCYYLGDTWMKNITYKKHPPLRAEQPLKELPDNLDFLL